MKIKSNIDSKFLDTAEEEIYQIVLNQHLAYNDRWFSSPFAVRLMSLLRVTGLSLSLFGTALTFYIIFNKPAWCPLWININYMAIAFVSCLIIFYFLPVINESIRQWNRNYACKNCKKIAGRCVKEARKQVPYTAEYEFKNNTITYFRIKNEVSNLAWTRKLKGVAYQGNKATVFFRKWTSFIPRIIVLHESVDSLGTVLKTSPVEIKLIATK